MSSKVHCDICDATPATKSGETSLYVPATRGSHRRVYLVVELQGSNDEERPTLDVCDPCRKKLVAQALGLYTAEQYEQVAAERDRLDNKGRTILVADLAVPDPPDNDIPF